MTAVISPDKDVEGFHTVNAGRSGIVRKPMAQLLPAKDCTITVAHSKTRDLEELIGAADIVIAAVGRPGFIRGRGSGRVASA